MSDVNVRLKLSEDASSKLKKIASAGREATKQLSNTGKALDNAFKSSSLDSFSSNIGKVMSAAEDDVESLGDAIDDALKSSGKTVRLGVEVSDAAASTLGAIEDRADALDGTSVDVEVGADDSATQVVNAVEDSVSALDGASASAEIGAEDNASQVIDAASDKVSGFDGQEGSAEIGAEDNASPVLDDVKDKAEAWDGSVWEATVSIVDGVTSPLSAIARTVRNPLVAAGSMFGVGIGVSDTVDTYANFEATMSRVQALSNSTSGELTQLTEKAKEMGAVTKYSGTESAEAFTYMAQAGWDVQSMIDGIGGIMSLAASDGIALADATDIVANALTSFGLTANDTARFADVLAVASSATNTDVAQLGEAFKYVAPVAGSLGYTIEDVSTALGLMSNNGIKGSMAGTSLKTSLANLAAPTDKMQSVMDKYNISLTDNEGNMKSLGKVMDNLRTSLGGLDEAEQTAAASMLFGKEAMAGMLSIINTSGEGYESLASQIENSTGAADHMAEIMQDNLAGTLEQLGGQMETLQLEWGERMSPYIADIANAISGILPNIQEAGLKVFDFLDVKIDNFKSRVSTMVNSDEWENADLFGKVNIAWNEIIAEPFIEWIGGDGKNLISKGLSALFSDAAKILPGGEKAGLTSWLSAGLLAKGSTSLISKAGSLAKTLFPIGGAIKGIGTAAKEATSIKGFISNLGSMVPAAGKFGIAAAAVTEAVVAIAAAINNYNQMQIENSLEEHFGDIKLDASQIEDFASRIINADWLVNINTSLGHFENSDELVHEAESALSANDALEWKARVGIELTEDEQFSYMQNIEAFKSNIESALTEKTLAAKMVVDTFDITMADGSSLGDAIGKWAEQDLGQMEYLSSGLTNLVQNALQDGILDVDEQAAIDQLQQKISNIMSGWQEAEAQAELDMLTQKYGRLSGADLEAGGFTSLVTELGEQRETAANALYESEKQVYATLNSLNQTNEEGIQRISDTDLAFYKEQVSQAARNAEVAMLMNSVQFEKNTMEDAYGDLLTSNYANVQAGAQQSVEQLEDLYTQYQNGTATIDTLFSSMDNSVLRSSAGDGKGLLGFVTDADQNAIHGLYEVMKPDMQELQGVVSEYQEAGQAIPQQIMDQFNDAMLIGAAAGDMDAAWYTYARSMVENGDKEMINAIQSGELVAPQEFKDALELAMTETTDEPITLDGLQAELDEIEVNEGRVNELLAQAFEGLEATGQTTTINGVAVVEYEVTAGQTMSEIASECGVALDELIAANPQIENPNVINVGQKINIPASACIVDASGVGEAANEAIDNQTGQTIEKEQPAKITITDAGTDISSAVSTSQDSVNSAFSSPLPANGSVDVTLEKGNDNVSVVYSSVGDIVRSAWSNPYSASGSVNVTLTANYSLANPSATISFGGGGSGSATVTAAMHATGGIFDEPHLGVVAEAGPEAIIPLDGSGNAMELWTQAGERLGLMSDDAPIASIPNVPLKADTGAGGDLKNTSKEINININGSGNLRVSGGMTKEDVIAILMEKARDVIEGIVEEDILVEGDGAYEY